MRSSLKATRPALVALARKETDLDMKKSDRAEVVGDGRQVSATDYMLEILNK